MEVSENFALFRRLDISCVTQFCLAENGAPVQRNGNLEVQIYNYLFPTIKLRASAPLRSSRDRRESGEGALSSNDTKIQDGGSDYPLTGAKMRNAQAPNILHKNVCQIMFCQKKNVTFCQRTTWKFEISGEFREGPTRVGALVRNCTVHKPCDIL